MQRPKTRNVLAIGVSPAEFRQLLPFLDRQSFDVDRFPSAAGALELVTRVGFEMLLVRYPLPDMELTHFLGRVRSPDSPCLRAPLLLLTNGEGAEGVDEFIGRGANKSINLEASEARIQETISSVLDVAPRKAARFLARLEIKIGDAADRILCQTENLSSTGMLIRTDRRYELGTEIEFEFELPDDPRDVRGVAEVVRHTKAGRDDVGGVGLRFLSFSGDSQRRFLTFLGQF
ncbi:MAG: PilZ domain-containing protein [Acidobacteriota bacterium]